MMAFAVGVSVGRAGEPSAIAVLEVAPTVRDETYTVTVVDPSNLLDRPYEARRTRRVETAPCAFAVRHIERFAAGASYPTMTGSADVEAWREGAADDMVFAVAVAAFVAEDLYSRTPAAPEVEFEDELGYM